jgi:hypothetical protein
MSTNKINIRRDIYKALARKAWLNVRAQARIF